MKSLVAWLHRLGSVTPDLGPVISYFRVAVPRIDPLDVENWLLSIDPQGPLGIDLRATGPESWSIMRVPDLPQKEANLHDRHRLGADIACLLSLKSSNGTFIGEFQTARRLADPVPIKNGHIFRVGLTRLRLGGGKEDRVATAAAAANALR